MQLYPLRTILVDPLQAELPLSVYTVGTELQPPITRLAGFSAKQLLFTLGGRGMFRPIGRQHEWDMLEEGSMLYIPDGLPHEYRPCDLEEPWHVGYVTFLEGQPGFSRFFGVDRAARLTVVQNRTRIVELLVRIWSCSGDVHDPWTASEMLYALMLELKKTAAPAAGKGAGTARYRDLVVDRATQFLHDHLQLHFSLDMLAAYVGYSSKQVVRMFKDVLGMTPLQYMQRVRLQTAMHLLDTQPGLSVKEVAARVGLEPIYFARLFKRANGFSPSCFAERFKGLEKAD